MDSKDTPLTQESLIDDLRQVIENAESLLLNTGGFRGPAYDGARERLGQALTAASEELARFEDVQLDRMMADTEAACQQHLETNGEARILRAFV
ncbi:MAG: DUF883 domain-containing protein [Pseudomonadota bacterium]